MFECHADCCCFIIHFISLQPVFWSNIIKTLSCCSCWFCRRYVVVIHGSSVRLVIVPCFTYTSYTSYEAIVRRFGNIFSIKLDADECEQCTKILEELENIDDDCDRHGITFVKTKDFSVAEMYGVHEYPALVYFEDAIPNVFEGKHKQYIKCKYIKHWVRLF